MLEHHIITCFSHFIPDPNASTAPPIPKHLHLSGPDIRDAILHSHVASHTIKASEEAALANETALKRLHATADWDLSQLIKHSTFLHALTRSLLLQTAHNPDISGSAVTVDSLAARTEASARAAAYRASSSPPAAAAALEGEDINDIPITLEHEYIDGRPVDYGSDNITHIDGDDDEEEEQEEEEEDITWIEWFCNSKGHGFFVEVDEDYIRDSFNLTGLRDVVPYYDRALNTVLDLEERNYMGHVNDSRTSVIENSAQLLYGLVHARFLITSRGLEALHDKISDFTYGICPNADCEAARQAVLPIGCDQPQVSTPKIYCPRCNEIYYPSQPSNLTSFDGAFFGSSAAHMFMMMYPHFQSTSSARPYEPRVYGFKVHYSVKDTIREVFKDRQQQEEEGR